MSSAKRLAALEMAAQQERQRRIDLNERVFNGAIEQLPDGVVKALLESDDARLGNPEYARRIAALCDSLSTGPLPDPVAKAAQQWAGLTVWADLPEDAVLTKPPSGAAAYMLAEAQEWERALREAVDPSEDFCTVCRWYAAAFHFESAVARQMEQL